MNARLSAAQVAELRRAPTPSPRELARDLGVSKEEAETILANLDELTPLWAGREPTGWVLALGMVLLALATAFTYSNNTEGAYLFDDKQAVLTEEVATLRTYMAQNLRPSDSSGQRLRTWRLGLSEALNRLFEHNRFRVVTYATFALEDWYYDEPNGNGGLNHDQLPATPEPHVHWVNNTIHLFNGLLAVCLAYLTFTAPAFRGSRRALRYPAWSALLVGVVFALHPLQTQAVSYLAQRAESLGTFFFLAMLCCLIWADRRALDGPRGERPELTVYLWSGVLALAGILILSSAAGALSFSRTAVFWLAAVAAAVAATVHFVGRGWDEPWHAAAVAAGVVSFCFGLESKEIVGVAPFVFLAWLVLFGRQPSAGEAPAPASPAPEPAPEPPPAEPAPQGGKKGKKGKPGKKGKQAEPAEPATPAASVPAPAEPPTSAEPEASLLPTGPAPLQALWGYRAVRAFATRSRLRYHAPWALGAVLVLLAFPLLGGRNFKSQFLVSQGVPMGGRQDVRITPPNYLATQLNVFHTYVRLAALPVGQNIDHDYPLALTAPVGPGPKTDPALIGDLARPLAPPPLSPAPITLLSLLLLLSACAVALRWGGRARVPTFALLLAILVLLPSSSLIVLADVIFEHRFYLPLLGAGLILAVLVERGLRAWAPQLGARPLIALALLLAVAGVGLSRARNEVWRDDETLWGDCTAKSPLKPRGWVNLGLYWQKCETHLVDLRTDSGVERRACAPQMLPGEEDVILHSYARQLPSPPVVPRSQIVAVHEIVELRDAPQKALDCYAKALAIEPYGKALNNVAISAVYRYQHLAFEEQFIRRNLVPRFSERGDQAKLEACRARLAELPPQLDAATAEAERCLVAKLGMGNADFFVFNNLGGLYSLIGRYRLAVYYIGRALKVPDHEEVTRAGLGEAHEKWGFSLWLAAHQRASAAERPAMIARAQEQWREALGAYREFLTHNSRAPQAVHVRQAVERLENWLRGQRLPDPAKHEILRTAQLD